MFIISNVIYVGCICITMNKKLHWFCKKKNKKNKTKRKSIEIYARSIISIFFMSTFN